MNSFKDNSKDNQTQSGCNCLGGKLTCPQGEPKFTNFGKWIFKEATVDDQNLGKGYYIRASPYLKN